ncbi:surface antigen-like protein [Sinobacterium caligoides]|uniref:Surface antigen-like protein n=1 Tax=Sinobacterium caligoides TaxID=933926 RepID=A0A3N2DQ71_9GAMM|nr:BamA/TamA family outer membrane protein [Sinobacterium caligoides]ROS01981.1 surface antigen-like protein [Sinobacterium caligoides]
MGCFVTDFSRSLFIAPLLVLFVSASVEALPAASVKSSIDRQETPDDAAESLLLPYAFSTDTMGLNLGLGGMRSGYYQEQMSIGATAFAGDVSQAVALGVWNYRLPGTNRLYFSAIGMQGYYPDQRAYASTRNSYTPAGMPRPGANSSTDQQYVQADGASNWWEMKLELALPIGATRERGLVNYHTREGLLVSEPSGGERWDPLSSGASVLMLRQFNRYQSYEQESGKIDGAVHGVELGLLYDNTDFPLNPSKGSRQYIAISRDYGWLESDHSWSFVELEASKYFSLGSSRYAHQRIVALNFWTGYSPSWQLDYDASGASRVAGGAPFNEGANLGGFYRMRGYDQHRFHDKAAIYGTAEYRYTLRYNPATDVRWLQFAKIDWFQLVAFVEAGRVGAEYRADELLQEVKTDFGFSLRAMMAGIVVRTDVAHSEEGTNLWVMVNHPF